MKGTYVFVVDEPLREKFRRLISGEVEANNVAGSFYPIGALSEAFTQIPLVGSAPCGNPIFGEENIEKYLPVENSRLKSGFEYFILRAQGDSMNLAGIEDGDLVLCRQQLKADTNDKVVALLGDNVTIKLYGKEKGRRVLLPQSTNKAHKPICPEEGDVVQGVVQEVLPSNP